MVSLLEVPPSSVPLGLTYHRQMCDLLADKAVVRKAPFPRDPDGFKGEVIQSLRKVGPADLLNIVLESSFVCVGLSSVSMENTLYFP